MAGCVPPHANKPGQLLIFRPVMRFFLRRSFTPEELGHCRFLSRFKLFENLSNEELVLFMPYLFLRRYKENEVVFFRNDPSQALYLIKDGQVTMSIEMPDGASEPIGVRPSHFTLGDNALLPGTRRLYTAVVTSETAEIYVVPTANIFDIFLRRPNIQAQVMSQLAHIYNHYLADLFKTYRNSHGFFEMSSVHYKKDRPL